MKYFLLFIFLILLLLPGIQKKFTLFKEPALKGAYTFEKRDSLTFKNCISGRFQQSCINSFNDALGFKTTFVRIFNQINFSIFNQSTGGEIVIGKSGYLYQKTYINTYLGKDKMKTDDLSRKIRYVHQIQNYLENKGIHFILVFAPNKARIYPEYIPSRYQGEKKHRTNYEGYLQIIRDKFPDLHLIDANAYFIKLKKTVDVPLYSKLGTHWTNYALHRYFLDSLVHYMGFLRKKKFPELKQKNLHWSADLQSPDDDLRQILNLLWPNKQVRLPYADFYFEPETVENKPDLLMISDSYYSMLYASKEFNSLLNKNNFWYYNKTRYPEDFYQGKTDPGFLRDDLLKHDFVILMATETNLQDLFLFPESSLSWLNLADSTMMGKEAKRQERIKFYIKAIYNNPEWLNNIKGQARSANKPLEMLIRDNAEYMVIMERKRKQE